MKDKLFLLYSWLVRSFTFFLPDAPLIMRFRGMLYSFVMRSSGKNFQVSSSVTLLGLSRISVGRDVYLASGVILAARAPLIIGDEVLIGFNSVIVSGNHSKIAASNSYRFGKSDIRPINIGAGSWIASNVTVTAGTEVGEGAFIGPASVAAGVYQNNSVNLCDKARPKVTND